MSIIVIKEPTISNETNPPDVIVNVGDGCIKVTQEKLGDCIKVSSTAQDNCIQISSSAVPLPPLSPPSLSCVSEAWEGESVNLTIDNHDPDLFYYINFFNSGMSDGQLPVMSWELPFVSSDTLVYCNVRSYRKSDNTYSEWSSHQLLCKNNYVESVAVELSYRAFSYDNLTATYFYEGFQHMYIIAYMADSTTEIYDSEQTDVAFTVDESVGGGNYDWSRGFEYATYDGNNGSGTYSKTHFNEYPIATWESDFDAYFASVNTDEDFTSIATGTFFEPTGGVDPAFTYNFSLFC